jgi:hypothetical protein
VNLAVEKYDEQKARWPREGRHILAQYDERSVVVYQAYRPAIGNYAAEHGRFGGAFSFSRMSWVKPNFLWMMYRCGWGTKVDQEVVLAVRLHRWAFDEILRLAVHSSYVPAVYGTEEAWRAAVASSDVRLQWDPDHSPTGEPVERRAIQLGMRGQTLRKYGTEWIVGIEDVSEFVREQGAMVSKAERGRLVTPREEVYPVADAEVARRLGVSPET